MRTLTADDEEGRERPARKSHDGDDDTTSGDSRNSNADQVFGLDSGMSEEKQEQSDVRLREQFMRINYELTDGVPFDDPIECEPAWTRNNVKLEIARYACEVCASLTRRRSRS